MSTKFLTVLLLLTLSSHATWTVGTDDGIDPKPLTWWRDTWTARPIEVSRSNASTDSNTLSKATLTFKVRTSTNLPIGGVFEVYFPTSFTAPSGNVDNYQTITLNQAVTAGTEYPVVIENVTMPTQSAAYGPFRIITRPNSGGQIYDINNSFASVYVTQPVSSGGALSITAAAGSSTKVLSDNTLQFSLNVNINIWPHDTIVIYAPSKWTIPTSLQTCLSVDIAGSTNEFKTASSVEADEHKLECTVSATEHAIYIYGIAQEIDISEAGGDDNELPLTLKIGGFKAPSADWQSTYYTWTVEFLQWGTRHIKRQYTGNGPDSNPDEITVNSWEPHNGYGSNQIIQNLTMYMDLSFTIKNPINAGGTVVITYTNVQMFTTNWKLDADAAANGNTGYCFLKYMGSTITCTPVSGQVTLTLSEAVPSNATFVLTNLVNFNNASPSARVTSYWKDGSDFIEIDRSANFPITYQTQNVVSVGNTYQLLFRYDNAGGTLNTNYITTGHNNSKYISVFVQINTTTFAASTTADIVINLPTNNTGLADNSVFINKSGTIPFKVRYDLVNSVGGSQENTLANYGDAVAASTDTNKISISNLDVSSTLGGSLIFFNDTDNNDSPDALWLPRVASNLATRYESWIVATVGSTNYVGFQVLTFTEADFVNFAVVRGCGNLLYVGFEVPFEVPVNTQDETRTYYLEYLFGTGFPSNDLGTKISVGNDFPYYASSTFSGVNVTLADNKTVNLTGQSYSNSSSQVYGIWFAVEAPSVANDSLTVTLYYNLTDDTQEKHTMIKQQVADVGDSYGNDNSAIAGGSQSKEVLKNLDEIALATVDITGLANTTKIHSLQFPQGFSLDSNAAITLTQAGGTSVPAQTARFIQSNDPLFMYPNILAVSNGVCEASTCHITVTGARASAYIKSATVLQGGHSDLAGVEVCQVTTDNVTVTVGQITIESIEPASTVDGRGPTSYHKSMTLKFSTENGIPANGQIEIVMDSDWDPTQNYCDVEGLDNESDSNTVRCQGSGNTFTIDRFAAFEGAKNIVATFNKVMPPTNTNTNANASIPTSNLFNSVTTRTLVNGSLVKIDEITTINEQVSVNPQAETGKTTFNTVLTIPPNAQEANVDLYINFTLGHTIPAGTVISIDSASGSWTLSGGNIKNYIYFSQDYTSVTATSSKINITTAKDIEKSTVLSLYIESALTNPAQNATNRNFLIKTTYRNVVFDQDTDSNADLKHRLTTEAAIGAAITEDENGTVVLSNATAGELSNYTFNFSSKIKIEATDEIWIKFPRAYDPFIGKSYIKYQWGESDQYYIDCNNTVANSQIECAVDHWYVRVFNFEEVNADTSVSITLKNVVNPSATTETQDFQIFQMRNNVAVSANRTITGVTITGLVNNINIKAVDVSDDRAFDSADYTFQFYMPDATTITGDHCIIIQLPRQYNTNLSRGNESISCTLHTQNLADSSTDLSEVAVSGLSSCSTGDNRISMCMPSGSSNEFGNTTRLYYRISNMANPEWGITRTKQSTFAWNFDVNDTNVFTAYDLWTNQYDILAYDSALDRLIARSYQDVNNAYHGFQLKSRGFNVNNYIERNRSGYISVNPGLMSELIRISTNQGSREPLAADKVVFTAKINSYTSNSGNISFYFFEGTTMYHMQYELHFKVAAPISITQGLYYINWSIKETSLDGAPDDLYDPPIKTLLEIYPREKASFTVETILPIGLGKTSRPIKIEASNPPHTAVNVDIALANNDVTGITIQPSTLNFATGTKERYFLITVDANFQTDNATTQNLAFSLSGTDTSAYNQILNVQFSISTNPQNEAGTITSCTNGSVTRTGATTQATADSNGIIVWAVAPVGTDIVENNATGLGDQLDSMVTNYFGTASSTLAESSTTTQEPEVKPSESDKQSSRLQPWTEFARRMYKNYLQDQIYVGASVAQAGTSVTLAKLEDLYAQTTYNSWCFVKNESQILSEGVSDSFTTSDMPDAATFQMKFTGTVSDNFTEELKSLWTRISGVQPSRALSGTRQLTGTEGTTATETTFTWTLPALRWLESPTPSDEVTLSSSQEAELREGIANLKIDNNVSFITGTITRGSIGPTSWVSGSTPKLVGAASQNTIEAEMQCSVIGEVCGICTVTNPDNPVNYNQVLLGLNEDNKIAPSSCENYTDPTQKTVLTISGLTHSTNYACYYACFNTYPTWPTPNEDTITAVITTQTAAPDDSDSSSAGVLSLVFALVLLLVFQY